LGKLNYKLIFKVWSLQGTSTSSSGRIMPTQKFRKLWCLVID